MQDSFTATSGNSVQDSLDHIQSISPDGRKITVYGNSWKRYKLGTPFEVVHATMLRLKVQIQSEAELFVFCLLKDTHNAHDGRDDCWMLSGRDASSATSFKMVSPLTTAGEMNQYEINIGSYFQGPVHYLAVAQDNDKVYTETRADGEGYVCLFYLCLTWPFPGLFYIMNTFVASIQQLFE